MRLNFLLIATLLMVSCKKENTITITLHEGSRAWLQTGFPRNYVNQNGDTLVVNTVSQDNYWLSDIAYVEPNSGFQDLQIIEQKVEIDSVTRLFIKLTAGLNDSTLLREDKVSIKLYWDKLTVSLTGNAWPEMTLNPPAYFFENFTINGAAYSNVYLGETVIGASRLTLYFTIKEGMVGFERSGEIYNLAD